MSTTPATVKKPNNTAKIIGWSIAGSLAAAGIFFGGRYLMGLKKFSEALRVDQTMKVTVTSKDPILNLIPTGIQLAVTPTVKNPTETRLRISQPYVEISLSEGGTPISTSELTGRSFDLAPLGQVTFDPIILNINLLGSAGDIGSFIKRATKEKKIGLYTNTVVVVNPGSAGAITSKLPDSKELKF